MTYLQVLVMSALVLGALFGWAWIHDAREDRRRRDDGRADWTMIVAVVCGLMFIGLVLLGIAHLIDYIALHHPEGN
jgi:fatty acid desaturase